MLITGGLFQNLRSKLNLESEGTFWYKIAIITLYTNIKVNSKGMFKNNLYFLLALTKYFLFTSNTDKIFPLHLFSVNIILLLK